jgi:hypothetical protein
MTEQTKHRFTEQEMVQILLHEYDIRCHEILNRTSNGFQLLAVGAALTVWMFSNEHPDARFWIAFALAIIVLSLTSWSIVRDIRKAAQRIRELEKDINARAGDKLLVWETYWGCDKIGLFTGSQARTPPRVTLEPRL